MKTSIVLLLISLISVFVSCAPEGLYGLGQFGQLYIINTKTAATKAIGAPPKDSITAQSLATVDSKAEIYYTVFYDTKNRKPYVVGLDMNTGKAKVNWTLPFAESIFVGVGQFIDFNPNNGELIITGEDPKEGGKHHMISLDPLTGKWTSIAVVGDIDVLGGASAFDAQHNIEFIELAVNKSGSISLQFLGYDIKTGKVVTDLTNSGISSLSYSPRDKHLYGFGIKRESSKTFERSTVRVEGNSGTVTTLGVIPDYKIMSSSIAALDTKHTVLYGFFAEPKNSTNFDLVGVSVENKAQIVTHPEACTSNPKCLWSLEFLLK